MGFRRSSRALVLAAVAGAVGCASQVQAAIVFNDTFGGSTVNTNSVTPTATSTNYSIASSKGTTPTANSGTASANDLKVSMVSTTSGIIEAQALFTTTPITLATVNDSVRMTMTFTDTLGILTAGSTTSAAMYMGLYAGNQSAPANTLMVSGLSSSLTSEATGYVQNWTGYVGTQFFTGGNGPRVVTRPTQSGASNTSQDLVSNNASASTSYAGGVNLAGTGGSAIGLTAGNVYTDDLLITLTAAGTYSIVSTVYSGAGTGGAVLTTRTVTATGANFYNGFDGLAFGWRCAASPGTVSTMDVSNIVIDANIQSVPEPASLAVLAMGGAALLLGRRTRR